MRRILTFTIPSKAVKKTDSHPTRWARRGGAWWKRGEAAGGRKAWQKKGRVWGYLAGPEGPASASICPCILRLRIRRDKAPAPPLLPHQLPSPHPEPLCTAVPSARGPASTRLSSAQEAVRTTVQQADIAGFYQLVHELALRASFLSFITGCSQATSTFPWGRKLKKTRFLLRVFGIQCESL